MEPPPSGDAARSAGFNSAVLPPLALNHVNLPARDPVALGRWYVEKFGFQANGRFLWSAGTLLVFVPGVPVASGAVHIGCRVESLPHLRAWVDELRRRGVVVPDIEGDEAYATVRVHDPEGNEIELFYEPVPAP
jgi:catechol 2,3-dioxygenase-like lactoylglutathione lyase family enzyme